MLLSLLPNFVQKSRTKTFGALADCNWPLHWAPAYFRLIPEYAKNVCCTVIMVYIKMRLGADFWPRWRVWGNRLDTPSFREYKPVGWAFLSKRYKFTPIDLHHPVRRSRNRSTLARPMAMACLCTSQSILSSARWVCLKMFVHAPLSSCEITV